jgi:protein-tyrosine phosphatase
MIDLHSHLLPGIDDGAPTLDVSIAMLDAYAANGFRTVAATPHLMQRLDDAYATAVAGAFALVEPHARERGIALVRGYEIRLAPDLPAQLRDHAPVTLDGTDVVLVDLPFTEWPLYADTTLFAVQTTGYRVVLAHPERYSAIQDDPARADDLVARGIALQVTIGSLSGAFGKRARRAAEALLERGVVQLLATDAHSAGHRMAAVPAGLERLRALIGDGGIHQLLVEAPAMLLNGDGLPPPVRLPERSWRDRLSIPRLNGRKLPAVHSRTPARQ